MKRLVFLLALAPALAHADADPADAPPDPQAEKQPDQASDRPAAQPAQPKRKKLYVRAGVAFVDPLTSSNELVLADVDGPASLAIQNGPIAGSGATIGSATILAIIIGYNLPYLDHRLALETVLGLPFTVKLQATGTLADKSLAPMALGIPTGVGPLGPELGEATAVPPMVTAVYRLRADDALAPYVGAGLSVLFATGAHVTNQTITAAGQPEFSISPAPGLVLQTGLDARIPPFKNVYARLDVKFMLMRAHAEMKHVQMATPDLPLFGTVEVGTAKMDMWVNPLIIQAGIGTDF